LKKQGSRGAVTVEYAVLVGFAVAMALGAWTLFGQRLKCALGFAADQFAADGSGQGLCSNGNPAPGGSSGPQSKGAVAAP
jgi:Flp pilus assembly pilin Flp